MSEFASTAMVKVILRGMTDLGIDTERFAAHQPSDNSPTIDIKSKRALLHHVTELKGVQSLVLLGRGVQYFTEEPTYRALLASSDPVAVLKRWQKLERYIHSAHRIEIDEVSTKSLKVWHKAKGNNPTPSLSESLVVVGVLSGLLQSMGVLDVTIHCGEYVIYPSMEASLVPVLAGTSQETGWTFRWRGIEQSNISSLAKASADIFKASHWPDLVKRIGGILLADLMIPASLRDIATNLAMSQRSLQRKLATLGFSYREILSKTRGNMAAWYLLETNTSLSEIGYLTGYSDQAHFTRDFHLRVGLSPANYRKNFTHVL